MPKDLFGDYLDAPANAVSATAKVPNVQPKIHNVPYKIAIIGEAPGNDEVQQGRPFVGYSGKDLDRFLSRFNILRDACFVGNICQHQPSSNRISHFDWSGPEIQGGLLKLKSDLQLFRPNIILLLGGSALHAFKSPNHVPGKRKKGKEIVFAYPNSISDWRGSFFESHMDAPLPGVKCIASYHPAACMRQYEWTPLLMMDISRCMQDATFADIRVPQRRLQVELSFERIIYNLDQIIQHKPKVGTDIEGYWNAWSCISFAPQPSEAFIVPFTHMDGTSLWSVDEEVEIVWRVAKILSDPTIEKVWQNGLYDRFCTQYGYSIVVRGRSSDIMLKHWEIYCELEKALGVQCSIHTREPFYKSDRKTNSREIFWQYCCKDSAVTIEIDAKIEKYSTFTQAARQHYEFNLVLLNPLLYMELRGIKYSKEAAAKRLEEVEQTIYELQYKLDQVTGFGIKSADKVLLRAQLRSVMCYKNDSSRVKKGYEKDFDINMRTLLGEGSLLEWELGRLSTAMEVNFNTKGQEVKEFLYGTLGLPKQTDPISGAITADYEALLTCSKKSSHPAIRLIIDIGELRTRAQMLRIETDPDGRVRSSYNEVGSETGRITSSTSPTGSGYNLQTIPDENELKPPGHHLYRGMRDLLVADDGCYLGKCDLKGADGWTVGANLAALGDSTMLDDLLYGLKPAQILCFARRHGPSSIIGKSRPELAELCKEVKKSDWDYFAYKQCIWGFCYLMGVRKACQHVFNVSEGTVTVKEEDMQQAQTMLFRRYNIQLWHKATEKRLASQPYPPKLTSPSGHTRMFFGRKADILGEALADEPQEVTTYATNMAVYDCWTDPENRYVVDGKVKLRVEPMHQVHDEFLSQFRIEDLEWAKKKYKQWFNHTIRIAGIDVVIPYDGAYGVNWAMDSSSKVGSI